MTNRYLFFKGRVALYAILKSMGIRKGDEIILPGFTCVVVPNAIQYLGAKPVYVDIDSSTYNIDPSKVEEQITPRTRAIIAQHTFGIPVDMEPILENAKRHNLYVIEDSCHAVGAKYNGRETGSFGDAAFFSSQWSKPVTTGLGGWAIINNPALEERIKEVITDFVKPTLREQSLLRLQHLLFSGLLTPSVYWFAQSIYRKLSALGIAVGSSSPEELECEMPKDYAKRMSPWQIKLLINKLQAIEQLIGHRRMITAIYEEVLISRGIEIVKISSNCEPVFLRYPVMVKNKKTIMDMARRERIELGDWFVSPIHPNLSGWELSGYHAGLCPKSEEVCEHIVNLPTHEKISPIEAERIAAFISANAEAYSKSSSGPGASESVEMKV